MVVETPVISTKNGALKGSVYESVYGDLINCYQGIPYGQPPVGPLRFKNPVPAKPWDGVKLVQSPPPPAPALLMDVDMKIEEMPGASEDCLYLNIYTPKGTTSDSKLPVMVWIHGGGFTMGTGNQTWAGPDYLVPQGVIMVSINYRLGVFGFLSFETPECSGNYGLKDQSLALRWVKENIAVFGGDATNITIFGESAGAASVHFQTLSPLSKGLFQRAIALSGSALCRWATSRTPRKSATLLAKKLGCPSDDPKEALEFLKKADVKNLLYTAPTIFSEVEGCWEGEVLCHFSFVPTKEPEGTPGAFLTKTPQQAMEDGDMADVPYITGATSAEAIFFALPSPEYLPDTSDIHVMEKYLPKELEPELGTEESIVAAKKIKQFYFPNGPTQEGVIRALSLSMLVYGTLRSVRSKYNKKTPNYIYLFDASRNPSAMKRSSHTERFEGACHADDLEYTFLITEGMSANTPIEKGSHDEKVKNTFTKILIDFAKTGTVPQQWKPINSPTNVPYVRITDKLEFKDGFFADDVQLWDEVYDLLTGYQ